MSDHPRRFLALGDSYTIGESVEESQRWPNQLARLLEVGQQSSVVTRIIAQTGWTTGELLSAIGNEQLDPPYDLVSLLIGVNNQYRGLDELEYASQLSELLSLAVGFAGGNARSVVVLSIPDWSVTPFAANDDRSESEVSEAIERFNRIKRMQVDAEDCHFVDITPISREVIKHQYLVADDGLHPSGSMYARWSEKVLPVAASILFG